jgi:predicted nucleic acid-binding protein
MAPETLARAQALAVLETGLARGVETHRIIRAARMLQEYELMFWDTLLARSAHET